MAEKRTAGLIFGPRIWIPLLVFVGAGLAWQLFGLLPGWIEKSVAERFMEQGVVVSAFPVEQIGFGRARVGEGALVLQPDVLQWDSIRVDYRARDLVSGRLNTITLVDPELTLFLPAIKFQPAGGTVAESTPAGAGEPPPPEAPAAPGTTVAQDPARIPGPLPVSEPTGTVSLWQQLQQLPLNSLSLPDGVMTFRLQGENLASIGMDMRIDRQPYGLSGELSLESGTSAAHLSVRAPADERIVTLQGEGFMRPGAIRQISEHFLSKREAGLPGVVSSGALGLDFFVDYPEEGMPYGSAQLSLEELSFGYSSWPATLGFLNVLVAGIHVDGETAIEGGMKTLLPEWDGFKADPFTLRFSYRPSAGLTLESESILWQLNGFSGRAALRGSAFHERLAEGSLARIELAFDTLNGGPMQVESFSVLAATDGAGITMETSPLGLRRSRMIWLEDVKAYWNFATQTGGAGLSWYDASGMPMGRLDASFARSGADAFFLALSLLDDAGGSLLSAEGLLAEEGRLEGSGRIPLGWVNALDKWGDFLDVSLSGPDPVLEFNLNGTFPFVRGAMRLDIRDLSAELGSGVLIEAIQASSELEIYGLPRTRAPQVVRAGRIKSGSIELGDVFLEWRMPTFRNLEIRSLKARTGGGQVAVDPFSMDPLEPRIDTVMRLEGIEANQFLEWLGEERFGIEGKISGSVSVGWEDGLLILGEGRLSMAETASAGRFVFKDPAFMRQQFASIKDVSPELKERFLNTLLEEGIRIDSMQADFGSADQPGSFLLRISISGESRSAELELPIKEFVINNLISVDDLGHLLGLFGSIRLDTAGY